MSLVSRDQACVWHPYSAMHSDLPVFPVKSAQGVRLTLHDGRSLIDGMASWWCVIHGYNHPVLNAALQAQVQDMAHVMFGGLTHAPAVELAELLVQITPAPLQHVFFADSGSVSIEAAMKMAIQYWKACGKPSKTRFVSPRNGYHGDTLHAMSVCDPVTGMHSLFADVLPQQFFVARPQPAFEGVFETAHVTELRDTLEQHSDQIAALILEPIVQGAGGMRFYSPDYLRAARELCDRFDVLLIADEIATGFGRTGRIFACEHAQISPDIMTLGKALTGGYMTLAAVLTTEQVSRTIAGGSPGLFMHGPTFMANPLACSVALSSVRLLLQNNWQAEVQRIEIGLRQGLAVAADLALVSEVRVLGAIGVIELHHPVELRSVQPLFVERGVWVRPFGKLVYLMPPFVMSDNDLACLCAATVDVVSTLEARAGCAVPMSA